MHQADDTGFLARPLLAWADLRGALELTAGGGDLVEGFRRVDFGEVVDLEVADFEVAGLEEADLEEAGLEEAGLEEAGLEEADLEVAFVRLDLPAVELL